MQLTVLGCRSGMPADGQASSGYLVDSGTTKILLDCGPGIAAALSAVMDPSRLDCVVISHLHLDHCYDLLPIGKSMLNARISYPGQPGNGRAADDAGQQPVRLYVPAGAREVLDRLAALFPVRTMPVLDKAFELAFAVHEYAPGDVLTVGDCRIRLYGLRHAAPNCGIRVESPTGVLAYTGDTGVTDVLVSLARGADLFLAEATLAVTDTGPHGHLSAADAAAVAASAGARQLVLTHFQSADPGWLNARRAEATGIFDGPVHMAAPNLRLVHDGAASV
jgi:ribonuclease BN (tRNA processing enzyme)